MLLAIQKSYEHLANFGFFARDICDVKLRSLLDFPGRRSGVTRLTGSYSGPEGPEVPFEDMTKDKCTI